MNGLLAMIIEDLIVFAFFDDVGGGAAFDELQGFDLTTIG
jgi:hypothetical protein